MYVEVDGETIVGVEKKEVLCSSPEYETVQEETTDDQDSRVLSLLLGSGGRKLLNMGLMSCSVSAQSNRCT